MANYDSLDLKWTWDGDLLEADDGDLAINDDDMITSLETEIQSILKSETGQWLIHPILGANLSDFRGEPNTRETAQLIEERVVSSLVNQGIVRQEDISVRVVPVGPYQVLITIRVNTVATPGNRLEPGESLTVVFTYDSLEDSVFFLPPNQLERTKY